MRHGPKENFSRGNALNLFFFPFPNDRTKEKVSFPHFHIVFIDLPLSTPLCLAPPLPFEAFSAKPFTIHCRHVTVCPVILPPSSLEALLSCWAPYHCPGLSAGSLAHKYTKYTLKPHAREHTQNVFPLACSLPAPFLVLDVDL